MCRRPEKSGAGRRPRVPPPTIPVKITKITWTKQTAAAAAAAAAL